MEILNNAGEKIKKYNNAYPRYTNVYKEILDARCGGNSLVDSNAVVSVGRLKVVYEGLKVFKAHRQMTEKGLFVSKLGGILERDELQKILVKLRNLRIMSVNLADIEEDAQKLYEALAIRSGLTADGTDFNVGATKTMNFIFPELFPMLDSNVARAVLNLHFPQFNNFIQYWKVVRICQDELLEWQNSNGSALGLLEFDDRKLTTLVRIFDKCAFVMDTEGQK